MTKTRQHQRCVSAIHRLETSGALAILGTIFMTAAIGTPAAQAQTYKVLHTFTGGADGSNPNGSLVLHSAGLYGTTSNGGYLDNGTFFRMDPNTGQNTVLHTFTGGAADGANPAGGLVADLTGNLYGTTRMGGIYNAGTIFRIDSSGESILLHSFAGPDGELPKGSLVRDSAGNLYGATSGGGVYNYGTVFKLDAAGTLTTLYSFSGLSDGAAPEGHLLLENSQLYGITRSGGAAGAGIVFRVDPTTGTATVLHSFAAPTGGPSRLADGRALAGSQTIVAASVTAGDLLDGNVARDSQGSLYRIGYAAGESAPSGGISVPQILAIGAVDYLIALRGFMDRPGGSWTHGDLALDSERHIYGAAQLEGNASHRGMIFEIPTNANQEPLAYPACVFTPPSWTQTVSWFNSGQEQDDFGYSYSPPNGASACRVAGVSYSASWLSGVTAQPPAGAYPGGTGYILLVAAVNTSTAPRAATIRLGSAFVGTLKQGGYPTKSCQYSPPTATIQVASGGGPVGNIIASIFVPPGHDGCIVYAATSKAPWISNLSPSANQAVGGGSVCGATPCVTGDDVTPTFNVAANLGAARSAVVRLSSGFALTVNQDAGN
jgi:uncharacterized repeat protein (TIGR03803 family)